MSKYRPLSDHFAILVDDAWRVTFTDIELLLGASLPKAAAQPAWWIGEGKAHQRAWLDQGWRVSAVGDGVVTFRRGAPPPVRTPAGTEPAVISSENALRQNAGAVLIAGATVAAVAGLGVVAAKLIKERRRA